MDLASGGICGYFFISAVKPEIQSGSDWMCCLFVNGLKPFQNGLKPLPINASRLK
jgi:hypothetical protein